MKIIISQEAAHVSCAQHESLQTENPLKYSEKIWD